MINVKTIFTMFILCFLITLSITAQDIIKAEYFFDSDPGVGNGTIIPLTPGDSVDLNLMADCSLLEPGSHLVSIRLMDENGVWTLLATRYFIIKHPPIMSPISGVEYFFDDDPGVGNGTEIPFTTADSIDITSVAETEGLEPGLHPFYLRVQDANGTWSNMGSGMIYIEPEPKTGKIIAAEYFFDNDPGPGNGSFLPIDAMDTLETSWNLPVPPDLDFGPHRLYVRVQTEDSLWSHYGRHYFEVCDDYGPSAGFEFQLGANRWASFEDMSENVTTWLWDFGDGNTDTTQNPIYQYVLPGIYEVTQYAGNACGTDTLVQEVVIRGIYSVVTNQGSNTGSVSLNVHGFGFSPDAELSLTREGFDPILPDTFSVQGNETISARFDLQNKEAGFWDVVVLLPGDTTFIDMGGFEIIEGGSPELQVTLDGQRTVLVNRNYNYLITVSNNGFADAVGIPLVIRDIGENVYMDLESVDRDSLWSDPFYSNLTSYVLANSIDSSQIDFQFTIEMTGTQAAAFVIPYVPAGSSLHFQIQLKLSESGGIEPKIAVSPQGYLTSASLLINNPIAEPLNCRSGEFRSALEMALDSTFNDSDWDNCFTEANMNVLDHLRNTGMNHSPGEKLLPYQGLNGVLLHEITSCLFGSAPDTSLFINTMILLNERFNTLDLIFDNPEDCNAISYDNLYSATGWEELISKQKSTYPEDLVNQIFNPVFSSKDGCIMCGVRHCMGCATQAEIEGVNSFDPNAKYGPGDNPYNNYLNNEFGLNYAIYFENADTATAPASQVKIADTLDPEKYDLSSFQFGPFGFNTHLYTALQSDYSMFAIYDLRPERPVYLKMEASLDTTSGYAEWVFSSLDTLSLQLTGDPLAGFLLPNVNHPEGEGFVSFTIDLNEDLMPGDNIDNAAKIYFDLNEPIDTDVWSNIFDNDLPESEVLSLPDTLFTETFNLEWEGSDPTSGVWYYDIYASTIDGPDTTQSIFRYHTGSSSSMFTGTFGERYYFYSNATDSAGNTEPGVVSFDADVLLWDPCLDPIQVNQFYEICDGDSALIQGTWYSQSGIYNDTLTSVYGCDSVIMSELTVFSSPIEPEITWDGTTLTSTPAQGYQWYLEDDLIPGANMQSYVPVENGFYSVEISDENGCLAISDPFEVTLTSQENNILRKIRIFPNPTDGQLNISNPEKLLIEATVYSPAGNPILRKTLSRVTERLNLRSLPDGIYHLRLETGQGIIHKKIIVN